MGAVAALQPCETAPDDVLGLTSHRPTHTQTAKQHLAASVRGVRLSPLRNESEGVAPFSSRKSSASMLWWSTACRGSMRHLGQ